MSRSLPLLWHRALRFGLTGLLVTGLHAITAIVLIEWLALAPRQQWLQGLVGGGRPAR